MRNLQFQDLFKIIRILKKAGLSRQARMVMLKAAEEKAKAAESVGSESTEEVQPIQVNIKELGMDFIFSVVENLGEAENEFYSFFADLTNKQPDDIKKLDLDEMVGMFNDFLQIPNLKSFFSKALNMIR